ncbi:DUF1501 domain-containing protein [Candidatus Aalborgicola defluviihabitans]|uniref:DUF1501 domain-containing protein n=1 Tax=Candidatus Aalborgicola defluviihabitans TaxID=3386187 RepID=UPI00390A1BEF|nr:DUF1501 domain-containing protein [Burkholderiales bacterium]
MTPFKISRRRAVQTLVGCSTAWAAPLLWAQDSVAVNKDARLIVVFLRGAYDGLSAFVPYGDPHYASMRPSIAIAPPDGTTQTTVALDTTFGLHPAMANLLPLWKDGVLSVIPCAGNPDATRSHFDAQHHWETGTPGKSSGSVGWMNTLTGLRKDTKAIGVGEANPLILAGANPIQLVPKGNAATQQGALGNERTRDAVLKLYGGQDTLSQTFRAGADSRMQTAQTLTNDTNTTMGAPGMDSKEMVAANNGAGPAKGLLLDAQHLGTLMRRERNLRLGFLSAGGWDTHANQGNVTGTLANNLGDLARTLVQLRKDFAQPNDVVMVCSEFGRTSAENGTRGTDHGHGNAMWLMGNRVQGGRWHGAWQGLAAEQLHDKRDLPVLNDFRGVFAQVLRHVHGLTDAELNTLFPGYAWDNSLQGLIRPS